MRPQQFISVIENSCYIAKLYCFIAVLTIIASLVGTIACSGRGELTRATALKLIKESEKFKAPIELTLKDENELSLLPNSSEETEQEAQARAIDIYMSSNQGVAVLRHLGYVKVKAMLIKHGKVEGTGPFASRQPWIFKIEATLTDKGREVGKSQGITDGKAVVLARREVIEITGIRKEGIQAAADFTWEALPTEAGKAFDPTSEIFKSLTPELQEAVTKRRGIGPFGSSSTVNWNEVHKSTAGFQKYDDGWRLTTIRS
jgi:hypothetical protein